MRPEKLDSVVRKYILDHSVDGCITELSSDDGFYWRFSNIDSEFYPIYSITKSFIATLVLIGSDEGKYDLSEPLSKFFGDEIPTWLFRVSVADLLAHRSGLGDYGYLKEYNEGLKAHPSRPFSNDELKKMAFEQGAKFFAGSDFIYSNVGYLLLVEFLEKQFSTSFENVLINKILRPLGLKKTRMLTTMNDFKSVVPGFSKIWSERLVDVREAYSPGWVAHRLIGSTTTDLNSFLNGVFSGPLLSPESQALIRNPHRLPFKNPWVHPSYGPGFLGDARSKFGSVLGHNGGGPGFSTASYCLERGGEPRRYLSVVINTDEDSLAEDLAFTLIEAVVGE